MRSTIVPAQVTTVEDRVMGNLSMFQLILMIAPIILAGVLYIIVPPIRTITDFKLTLMAIIAVVFWLLTIRIRSKLIMQWLVIILRFNLRPKYYLFHKSLSHREQYDSKQIVVPEKDTTPEMKQYASLPKLAFRDAAEVLARIENPTARLSFETTKKGGLSVRLTEIDD